MRRGYGVVDGGFARITTDYGQCMLKVVVSERQQRGMLFAPIHWSEATASAARVGALVAPFTDPFSGQPENKATPASIAAYEFVFRGFALSRTPLKLPDHVWWARVTRRRRLRLSAGRQCRPHAMVVLVALGRGRRSCRIPGFRRWGLSRGILCRRRRIETCLFLGPARDAGDWNVVKELFAADTLGDDQRRMLLSGKSMDGLASAGPVVCACFGVGRTTICDAIAAGRALRRRTRPAAQGGHQLRLVHSRTEAADRASRLPIPNSESWRRPTKVVMPGTQASGSDAVQSDHSAVFSRVNGSASGLFGSDPATCISGMV